MVAPRIRNQNNRQVRIFRAQLCDSALARQAVSEVHGRKIFDESAVADFLSDSSRYLLLATEQDRVLGSLNGYALRHLYRPEPQFLLYEIDVRPECRNRGIGKALVESFVGEAKAAAAFEVWVLTDESNPAALKMYTACGLRREGRDQILLNWIFHHGLPASP